MPIERESQLPIESSSSPTATPGEEAPQPFGSPSALWTAPVAAQRTPATQTADDLPDQAMADAVHSSQQRELWDQASPHVPHNMARDDSIPAESAAAQSASAVLTQRPAAMTQQTDAESSSQEGGLVHQLAVSQDAVPSAVQDAVQSTSLLDQPTPADSQSRGELSDLPTQATTSQQANGLPEQATPSRLISSWPDQATPSVPKMSALRGVGAGVTPKTAGTKEYGSWWTPPLPRGLTPAWMKMKTPAWVKKMRQLDMVTLLCIVLHRTCLSSFCLYGSNKAQKKQLWHQAHGNTSSKS